MARLHAGPAPEPKPQQSLVLQRLGHPRAAAARGSDIPRRRRRADSVPAGTPLKLYQPAHQRHYLVACSLVCGIAGLPDRGVEAGRGEQIACVIRRLLPPSSGTPGPVDGWDEYAWVARPHGYVWQKIGADPLQVLEDEERLPLFAVNFAESEKRKRRLFAGVIPVGKRDAYLGAPKGSGSATPGVTPRTSRKILLRKEVIEPWKSLVRRAQGVQKSFIGPFLDGFEQPKHRSEERGGSRPSASKSRRLSWFILLDFAKFLATYVKPVWRAGDRPVAARRC